MPHDVDMRDEDAVREEDMMYGSIPSDELDEKYPYRPHNVHKSLPFYELFTTLFNPLNELRKKPAGAAPISRKKQGPHGPARMTPHDAKRNIISKFVSRWRVKVGNDFYPALRLIVPEKDRDRAMYGLKEKTIGKLLVKIIGIDKNSEDAFSLVNWKLPGRTAAASAGDFGARCFEVLSKRPILTSVGNMSVADVNERLDKLSVASKENEQMAIFEDFYRSMNAEEMMWLIRIILRQMKVGATEKSFFELWHPDADSLFNVSSSLRRVCWELYDPEIRLDNDKAAITLMQCFQPQLANFQMHSFEKMAERMRPTEDDAEFWVEEKLDGERMQLHMVEDNTLPGGRRFNFWSRKAKDYTYLYGESLEDNKSSLTRHLKDAFGDTVRNIILDGEMITWDMNLDAMKAFGTLKTAALSEGQNPYGGQTRPLFRVFDCLYLNDKPITQYTLRDRRKALLASVSPVSRRLEIHDYIIAQKANDIEPLLRKVVAEASEGLVLKNPRSAYHLNDRNDDWIKVKPEYMTEFGEALDCVVVGGYYGSGRRGNMLSSFMCALRVDDPSGATPQKCWSFFKVGGGMSADDYRSIHEATKDKWQVWDPKSPPTNYVELAGGSKQYERPDMWIKPEDSVVLAVKAASVAATDQFRMDITLRFPRFKALRADKSWKEALSIQGFLQLKHQAEEERKDKKFEVDTERKTKRAGISSRKKKKSLVVHGAEQEVMNHAYAGPNTKIFEGLHFFLIGDAVMPFKKSKAELERFVKSNGGSIVQSQTAQPSVICVADRELVKVRSIKNDGKISIVRPAWLFDCVEQCSREMGKEKLLLPMEKNHMFFTADQDLETIERNTDESGDAYCRDVTVEELRSIFSNMPVGSKMKLSEAELLNQFVEHGFDIINGKGFCFRGVVAYFENDSLGSGDMDMMNGHQDNSTLPLEMLFVMNKLRFGGGSLIKCIADNSVTHIVVFSPTQDRLRQIRQQLSEKTRVPRVVTSAWVEDSLEASTLLDEERYPA